MKHLKTYEIIKNNDPQIEDYVICRVLYISNDKLKNLLNFIENNIGLIVGLDTSSYNTRFVVEYDNIPKEIKNYFKSNVFFFSKEEIVKWSKSKKDLEIYIDANKYNL